MRPLRTNKGAIAPLFDRLFDDDPGVHTEPVPRRYLDLDGLAESVEFEIQEVLTTRCGIGESDIDYADRSVVNYGLVDLSHLFTTNPNDRQRIARHVARTIAAYEPRLTKVNVVVEDIVKELGEVVLRVEGDLLYGDQRVPISFPVRIAGASGGGGGGY